MSWGIKISNINMPHICKKQFAKCCNKEVQLKIYVTIMTITGKVIQIYL